MNLHRRLSSWLAIMAAGAVLSTPGALAASRIWTGSVNSDWFNSSNWNPSDNSPQDGDSVTISSGGVILSNSTALLDTFTISITNFVFTNWTTALRATTVIVQAGGSLTHAPCDTNASPGNTNRVYILCTNLTVLGQINANRLGYRGAPGPATWAQGPGAASDESGGSYGGYSRLPIFSYVGPYYNSTNWFVHAGQTYGSSSAPSDPGSGGGGRAPVIEYGGHGGGAVWIEAAGHVLVNGTISADGMDWFNNAGGGSGGSIYIKCRTFGATNGVLSAKGGQSGQSTGNDGHGGGGGRIALVYDTTAQSALNATARPVLAIHAEGGWAPPYQSDGRRRAGYPGTIYLSDAGFYPTAATVLYGGELIIPGFSSWAPASLTLSGGVTVFPAGFSLTTTNGLTITGNGGGMDLSNSLLQVGSTLTMDSPHLCNITANSGADSKTVIRDLVVKQGEFHWYASASTSSTLQVDNYCVVTNGGRLFLHSGPTNSLQPGYGACFNVARDVIVSGNGSWIHPLSDPTNGGSVFMQMRSLLITTTNAGMDATERGYGGGDWYGYRPAGAHPAGYGPGAGNTCGSGGYGGPGAVTNKAGGGTAGGTYGSMTFPLNPGSGGGGYGEFGGSGGGLVWIKASRTVSVNGAIRANSNTFKKSNAGAGGSGGGIYIRCRTFNGTTDGVIEAKGGHGRYDDDWSGASGGGGRIAVWRTDDTYLGAYSVTNGTGYDAPRTGKPGTLYFGYVVRPGTLIVVQ